MFGLSVLYRVFYRVRQFFRGLFAKITPADEEEVQGYLSAAEYALFCRMPLDARCHSLNVLRMLVAAGKKDADLLVAALLHDVGKVAADESGTKLSLWMRGPMVLLELISPRLMERIASASPADGWRYALYVQLEHPRIGAEWAEAAGSSKAACWLIAAHQQKIGPTANATDEWETPTNIEALPISGPALASDSTRESTSHLSNVNKNLPVLLADLQWADGQN